MKHLAYFLNWWNLSIEALILKNLSFHKKRKAPCHFEIGDGKSYHDLTFEEHYRTMYFEALDFAVSSIKE